MKKFFVLGLVAVALSAGLMLTSCSKCPGGGNTSSKGDCKVSISSLGITSNLKVCSDNCIGSQISKDGVNMKSSYKCNC